MACCGRATRPSPAWLRALCSPVCARVAHARMQVLPRGGVGARPRGRGDRVEACARRRVSVRLTPSPAPRARSSVPPHPWCQRTSAMPPRACAVCSPFEATRNRPLPPNPLSPHACRYHSVKSPKPTRVCACGAPRTSAILPCVVWLCETRRTPPPFAATPAPSPPTPPPLRRPASPATSICCRRLWARGRTCSS